jgi:hypothetical protein
MHSASMLVLPQVHRRNAFERGRRESGRGGKGKEGGKREKNG